MQVRQSMHRSRPHVAVALLLAAGSLVACERVDPNQHALATGSAKLQANSGGAYANAYPAKNYKDTIELAKPIATAEANSAQGSAASVLVGASQLGKAQAVLDEAAQAEQASVNRSIVLRTLLDNWTAYNVSAASASSFDPTPMLSQADADRAATQKEVDALQSKLQDVERRLADLRARAKQKFDEADRFALEFAKARESLGSLSASEAESRLTAAREQKRKGDAIRVEASRLQAQADVTQPEAQELKVLIAASQSRIAGLDREKLELNEKAQQGRANAAQSQSAAADTAKQIEASLKELAAMRSGEVMAKYDQAIAELRAALTTAKGASGDSSASGKILVGRTQLALAGVLAGKASSLKSYASLLGAMSNAVPPLPFADSVATQQKETSEQWHQATDDAKQAFEAAQSAFSSVQLRGQGAASIKERMTQLSEVIGALAGKSQQPEAPPAPDAPAPAAPASNESAPATPSAAAGPTAEAAWEEIFGTLQSGNRDAFFAVAKLQEPGHETILEAVVLISGAQEKLDNACKEKFGQSLVEAQAKAMGTTAPLKASDYKLDVQGDAATVSHPAVPTPIKLVRENGKWLVDSSSFTSGPIAMLAPRAKPVAESMELLSVDIKDGKIVKIEDVMIELQKRVMASLQGGG
ncbi:MAG: hypothetical protein U0570_00170 [Phycisphaerales bacterium]